jgi:transposase
LSTKLHVAIDTLGNPLRVILTAGQVADIECAPALISHIPASAVVADKGYDSDALVHQIEQAQASAVIPPRSNRRNPRSYDRNQYKSRNLIERFFNRLKNFRRVATRYDKLARNFMAFVQLACAMAPKL